MLKTLPPIAKTFKRKNGEVRGYSTVRFFGDLEVVIIAPTKAGLAKAYSQFHPVVVFDPTICQKVIVTPDRS